ncbi:MAG: hypothetical protein H8E66_10460 [Planctomycetes bacterium]|nr:hypothetical protein [Planctomycetota bacterium]
MARPQKQEGYARNKLLQVRLLPGEYEVFKESAESTGLDLSAWVRERLRQAARRDLKAARDDPAYMEPKTQ